MTLGQAIESLSKHPHHYAADMIDMMLTGTVNMNRQAVHEYRERMNQVSPEVRRVFLEIIEQYNKARATVLAARKVRP